MRRPLTVAISPCPNDTFVWGAIALGYVKVPFSLRFRYEDIQTLNQLAHRGEADILKISFYQYALLPRGSYQLLSAGAALGYGVGPLLVARRRLSNTELSSARIGIPGKGTTAYSLLRFFLPQAEHLVEMRYEKLMPAVARGDLEAAVIIHESRFTYKQWGLVCLQDLGEYWTQVTGYPIPLGGVAVRRGLPRRLISRALRYSLRLAWQGKVPGLNAYIGTYAQELNPSVQKAHIDLYVNSFTQRLGPVGSQAVRFYLRWVQQQSRVYSNFTYPSLL
ncbi:MAG: 1,4-dihydroxy-6-naphthoate synthase [Bacteroidia bacterium]|nr:1,4-dihydroxy-6-naphthoate synthase [Bacteroidia bacterium]